MTKQMVGVAPVATMLTLRNVGWLPDFVKQDFVCLTSCCGNMLYELGPGLLV